MSTQQPSPAPQQPAPARSGASSRSSSSRRVWLVVGLILVVGVVTWLLVRGGDDDNKAAQGPEVKTGVPTVLSEADLRAYGRAQGLPVYWAGPQPNRRYEVTHTANGRYFVRYLTPQAKVGDQHPRFLTIGTYPGTNAYGALRTSAPARAQARSTRSPERSSSSTRATRRASTSRFRINSSKSRSTTRVRAALVE